MTLNDNVNIEIKLLLEAIYLKYGYDFRGYAHAHIKRRLLNRLKTLGLKRISDLQKLILYDKDAFARLLKDLSINVTEMFRDPSFYLSLRNEVIPVLRTYPFIKVWHAGCATGEEVYSMAIILKEEGLYERTRIYATDLNSIVLDKASEGVYVADQIKNFTSNYQQAGGKGSFADYYSASHGLAMIDRSLKEKIVFSNHNLVTDGPFGEMNLILCRNVLIYFSRELQDHVIGLFTESLGGSAYLCLGSKESLKYSGHADMYDEISKKEKIFRKKLLWPRSQ